MAVGAATQTLRHAACCRRHDKKHEDTLSQLVESDGVYLYTRNTSVRTLGSGGTRTLEALAYVPWGRAVLVLEALAYVPWGLAVAGARRGCDTAAGT